MALTAVTQTTLPTVESLSFYGFSHYQLTQWLSQRGFSEVHGKSLFRAAYRNCRVQSLGEIREIPKALQRSGELSFSSPAIAQISLSEDDGSAKLLLSLEDEKEIEAVLMPETERLTLCVSSQVGCRQACSFCATGRMGLTRQLSAAEIVGQLITANRWLTENQDWLRRCKLPTNQVVTNVVFMGMGEPLDNVAEVARAVSIMTDPLGLGIAPRKVTVSTAGHLDGLREFVLQAPRCGIAISLHATEGIRRSALMPINRRYPLEELLDWCRSYTANGRRHILIQYTLISGVNDSQAEALKLADLLRDIRVKVNLIPLNPISRSRFERPEKCRLKSFQTTLLASGIRTMIRFSKGPDISGACGQLAARYSN